MRAFVALPISKAVLAAAGDCQRELAELAVDARLTRVEGLHLTLHFLGDIDADQTAAAREALAEAGSESAPLLLEAGGVGAFPDIGRPRVVWMGVRPDNRLLQLQQRLGGRLERAGLITSQNPFRPHVTLARLRRPDNRLHDFFARTKRPRVQFEVDSMHLYESRLGRGAARYVVVASSPLGEA